MSKSQKKNQGTAESQEKVVTRYDLKMQRRAEQKKKEEREKKITTVVGILIVVGLVCLVASFPIRTWVTVNGTYITVGDEKVSRVEFDYNYNLVLNSYLSQNYYFLSLLGLDLSGDLSQQMFSDTLTWKDFFEEMTVDNLRRTKALKKEMEAAGFTYDVDEEYAEYQQLLQDQASDAGVTVKAYVQEMYGTYATLSRIQGFVKESLMTAAYYNHVRDEKMPSDQEITDYYEENKDSYDSVDYRLITVNAELPTEPTELADPVEETEGTEGTSSESQEETEYKPSEAEIEFAMQQAKTEADEAEKTVLTEGEFYENMLRSSVSSTLREWLFDSARTSGDTTVIEDTTNNCYYVLAFVDRYLDQSPSADLRVILTVDGNTQAILDEWKAGEVTEESFAALADQYNDSTYVGLEGGLLEAQVPSRLPEELENWINDKSRSVGDAAAITLENSENDYVVYYKGQNDPLWKLEIRETLLDDIIMVDYIDEILQNVEVKDPKGRLNYLIVQAQEEADGAAASE